MTLSNEVKKRLAGLAPQGYDAELARLMVVAGRVQPITELSAEDKEVMALATEKGITAGGPAPITDGRPTLMRVVAWMCHEGVNRNGDAFVAEELSVAAGKVSARNPLVMDWNHAAIVGGQGRIIGVWSKLDYAFDKKAKDGQGAWGILAEGVMFAWAYPDIADTMLAEQQRHNKIDFSMACIPSSVEFGEVEGKRAAILHNPVFFTLSALDVAPGDKDAVGVAKEGANAEGVEETLKQELIGASEEVVPVTLAPDGTAVTTVTAASNTFTLRLDATGLPWLQGTSTPGTLIRTAKMEVKLALAVTKNAEGVLEIAATAQDAEGKELATERTTVQAAGVVKAEELVAANAKLSETETLLEASKISHAEVTAQVEKLSTEKAELEAQLAAKDAELAAATAKIAEIDAAKAETERLARLQARMKQLPEAYVEAHAKREEAKRVELETEWSNMSEEAWTAKLEDINLALPKGPKMASYLERSKREGALPVAAAGEEPSIESRIHKFTRQSR